MRLCPVISCNHSTGEMEMYVLARGNGETIAGGWAEAPSYQHRKHLFVNARAHALQYFFPGDVPGFVNRDLDNDVARKSFRQLRAWNPGVGECDRQRRTNIMAVIGTVIERSKPRARGRTLDLGVGSVLLIPNWSIFMRALIHRFLASSLVPQAVRLFVYGNTQRCVGGKVNDAERAAVLSRHDGGRRDYDRLRTPAKIRQ